MDIIDGVAGTKNYVQDKLFVRDALPRFLTLHDKNCRREGLMTILPALPLKDNDRLLKLMQEACDGLDEVQNCMEGEISFIDDKPLTTQSHGGAPLRIALCLGIQPDGTEKVNECRGGLCQLRRALIHAQRWLTWLRHGSE